MRQRYKQNAATPNILVILCGSHPFPLTPANLGARKKRGLRHSLHGLGELASLRFLLYVCVSTEKCFLCANHSQGLLFYKVASRVTYFA